ncbi:MAG: M14 family zinc carboxypeptidase [Cyclobacteriaceae bacterium]
MKKLYTFSILFSIFFHLNAQTKSPAEFLGYELGERFTPHHRVVAYFQHVAASNSNVKIQEYGKTNEWRPLMVAFISSEENIEQLETIRTDNLKRAGILSGETQTRTPVTWMSYNVHGNEAVSSEATMMTLFSLVDPGETQTKDWLENTLVVLDPCLNPDGHDRYVNWYNQKMNEVLQPDPQSIEHMEPWPGGRPNHYLFDLNRDWAWQTQAESRQRLALYNEWLPQVHLDFHEQGVDDPYYFAPAAEPLHHQLTPFQMEYQEIFGQNTADYFDQNDWFYFTKERFDLLYPSYGDTYPMYNGAIGMTIEQGGSGRAGIGIINAEGDTLTLKERIVHHHTTGLSAIETTSGIADRVLDEFEKYFKESSTNPSGKYQSFVIKASNPQANVESMLKLLDKNGVQYGISGRTEGLKGFSYQSGADESFELAEGDIIINAYQPKSVLTQVLFEPNPALNDSLTYDITSWAIPYGYNLEAYALENRLDADETYSLASFENNQAHTTTLAYISPWHATKHAAFLSALMKQGIRVRYSEYDFMIGDASYPRGSLIITRGGNQYVADFHQKVTQLANDYKITLGQTTTGYVDGGKDFGSSHVKTIPPPKVVLIGGEGTSSLNFGEIWFFLDQELAYPTSVMELDQLEAADLGEYDVMVLPDGDYTTWNDSVPPAVLEWVKAGGKLIAIEAALENFVDKEDLGLKQFVNEAEKEWMEGQLLLMNEAEKTAPYIEKERWDISNQSVGAIFEVNVDQTHSLGYGTGGKYYTLKNNSKRYAYLEKGVNAGYIADLGQHRTGFIGYKVKSQMANSLVFGTVSLGEGQLIYFVDNPVFRNFWESGKLILANALFLTGN